jgi:hypothetical protein
MSQFVHTDIEFRSILEACQNEKRGQTVFKSQPAEYRRRAQECRDKPQEVIPVDGFFLRDSDMWELLAQQAEFEIRQQQRAAKSAH